MVTTERHTEAYRCEAPVIWKIKAYRVAPVLKTGSERAEKFESSIFRRMTERTEITIEGKTYTSDEIIGRVRDNLASVQADENYSPTYKEAAVEAAKQVLKEFLPEDLIPEEFKMEEKLV